MRKAFLVQTLPINLYSKCNRNQLIVTAKIFNQLLILNGVENRVNCSIGILRSAPSPQRTTQLDFVQIVIVIIVLATVVLICTQQM